MRAIKDVLTRFAATCVFCVSASAVAGAPSAFETNTVELEPVVVNGIQPGPALWKVGNGDHVMWVLGITSPLPTKMQWETAKIERAIEGSQEVLKAPGLDIGARAGFFGKLSLLPSLIGLKKNPDGATLEQVLTSGTYRRWQAQKSKYLGRDSGVERLRPLFAGKELYEAALEHADLADSGIVQQTVYDLADRHRIPLVDTAYRLILDAPRAAIKTFKASSMDDEPCLRSLLDAVRDDLAQATMRAGAWATGNMEVLRSVRSAHQQDTCLVAIGDAGFAQKLGMTDVQKHIEQTWLAAARRALANNRQTFALLPMEQVILPGGYLAKLRHEGYRVEPPENWTQQPMPYPTIAQVTRCLRPE